LAGVAADASIGAFSRSVSNKADEAIEDRKTIDEKTSRANSLFEAATNTTTDTDGKDAVAAKSISNRVAETLNKSHTDGTSTDKFKNHTFAVEEHAGLEFEAHAGKTKGGDTSIYRRLRHN